MAEPAVVTIRRQVLEIDLHGSEADGHSLQRRLPAVCADVVSPAIESALGAIDPGEGYLYLDRLAIDLAVTSLDGLEAELARAVRREIEDHFRRHPPPRVGTSGVVSGPGDGRPRTAAQTVDEALVTFLRIGRLPWSFRLHPGQTLEQRVVDSWGSDGGGRGEPPPSVRQRLVEVLAIPEARQRLVMQFSPGFALGVIRSLSPRSASRVEQIEAAPVGSGQASPAWRAFTRQVRLIALGLAAEGRQPPVPASIIRSAWMAVSPTTRADRPLAAALESLWRGCTGTANEPASAATAELAPERPATPAGVGEAGGLLVDCAGLVLLHPFLPRFFEGLGVAAGDRLVDPDRAVSLLHQLATGEVNAPEHRLTLPKALCGIALERPVEADVGLGEAETAEATALLEAAIRHWDALRSTSPDGLRAEFLQRTGVLSVTAEGDWLLRVEARTVDILLDQLPWGFSPLWLPWMDHLMMVEWR